MGKQDFEENKKYQIDSVNIFLLFRLFFIRKPVSISIFKIIMKPVSIILFKLQIRKFFRKKLVKIFLEKRKRFHIKLNFRQKLIIDFSDLRRLSWIIKNLRMKHKFIHQIISSFMFLLLNLLFIKF